MSDNVSLALRSDKEIVRECVVRSAKTFLNVKSLPRSLIGRYGGDAEFAAFFRSAVRNAAAQLTGSDAVSVCNIKVPVVPSNSIGALIEEVAECMPPGDHQILRISRAAASSDVIGDIARLLATTVSFYCTKTSIIAMLRTKLSGKCVSENVLFGLGGLLHPYILQRLEYAPRSNESSLTRPGAFLLAASVAMKGNVKSGKKHGCVAYIVKEQGRCDVLGVGFNRRVVCSSSHRYRVVHAEADAAAKVVQRLGAKVALQQLKKCEIVIVEIGNYGTYENAVPCRKCYGLMVALGILNAVYSTPHGPKEIVFRADPALLKTESIREPFRIALQAAGAATAEIERCLE